MQSETKKFYVGKSGIHNKGIFAKRKIKKGEIVGIIKGPRKFKVNKGIRDALANPDWVGFDVNYWVDPIPPYKHLNHSCDPNVAIRGHKTLIAIKNIVPDEEITIDYSIIEADPRWHMKCACKQKGCRKVIGSIHSLPGATYRRYLPFISKRFQAVYNKG